LEKKDDLKVFLVAFFATLIIEIMALITGMRVYVAPEILKPFIVLSIGLGEGGGGFAVSWLIAKELWRRI